MLVVALFRIMTYHFIINKMKTYVEIINYFLISLMKRTRMNLDSRVRFHILNSCFVYVKILSLRMKALNKLMWDLEVRFRIQTSHSVI